MSAEDFQRENRGLDEDAECENIKGRGQILENWQQGGEKSGTLRITLRKGEWAV